MIYMTKCKANDQGQRLSYIVDEPRCITANDKAVWEDSNASSDAETSHLIVIRETSVSLSRVQMGYNPLQAYKRG